MARRDSQLAGSTKQSLSNDQDVEEGEPTSLGQGHDTDREFEWGQVRANQIGSRARKEAIVWAALDRRSLSSGPGDNRQIEMGNNE